jgi:hypothetical protein
VQSVACSKLLRLQGLQVGEPGQEPLQHRWDNPSAMRLSGGMRMPRSPLSPQIQVSQDMLPACNYYARIIMQTYLVPKSFIDNRFVGAQTSCPTRFSE